MTLFHQSCLYKASIEVCRQTSMWDTGQIRFLYSAEVFCKKLGLAMEIISLKSPSVPCGDLIEGGDEDNPPSEQQTWLTF